MEYFESRSHLQKLQKGVKKSKFGPLAAQAIAHMFSALISLAQNLTPQTNVRVLYSNWKSLFSRVSTNLIEVIYVNTDRHRFLYEKSRGKVSFLAQTAASHQLENNDER